MKRARKQPKFNPDQAMTSAVRSVVEQLERRVLLSTDPLLQDHADAIKAGLQGVSDWAETVETFASFGSDLPLVGGSLGELVDFSQLIQQYLAIPINGLGNTPSTDEIRQELLDALPGGSTVDIIEDGGKAEFKVNTTIGGATHQVSLDLGTNAFGVGIDGDVTFEMTTLLDLNLTFGVDFASGLAASERFYVKLNGDDASNPTGFRVAADVTATSFSGNGKVGFLEVGIGDGTSASSILLDAEARLGLNDPDLDGRVSLSELLGNSLAGLLAAPTFTGTVDADIPVSASLGTFTETTAKITVDDANLFDATAPAIGFTGSNPLKDFKNLSPRDMVSVLQQLGASLQGITETLAPVGGVPFLGDALQDVLNFGDKFFDFAGAFFDAFLKGANSYTATMPLDFSGGSLTFGAASFKIAVGDGTFEDSDFTTINFAGGSFATADALVTALNTALGSVAAAFSFDGGRIKVTGNSSQQVEIRFAGDDAGMRQLGFIPTLANANFKFDSLQTFLDRLNELDVLGSVGDLAASYDAATSDLTFKLRIDQAYHDHLELHFADALGLGAGFPELSLSGHAHIDFDASVNLDLTLGVNLKPLGNGVTLSDSTALMTLGGGTTFFDSADDGKDDFKIVQSNGQEWLINLDSLAGTSTIGDLKALIAGLSLAPNNMVLDLVPTGTEHSLRLTDFSTGAGTLKVIRLNNSLGAKILGIEGQDVIADDGVNQITGAPLHGDSFQSHIFLKEGSSITANATLSVPDDDKINLIAALGMLEVGIVDGDGNLTIGTGLVLNDPGTGAADDGKVHLDDLLSSPTHAVLTATNTGPSNGKLSGNAAFNLNINNLGDVAVTLNADNTNASLTDLIEDFQTALGSTSFSAAYDDTPFEGKKLGEFIFVSSKDGKLVLTGLVGTIKISFTAGNPAEALGFATGAVSPASLIASGHLTASGSIDLPLTFPGVEFLGILAPNTDPKIELEFSTGSPIDFVANLIDLPSTEDITKLFDFSEADFLTMLQQIVTLLQNKDVGLLNEPLPLLDKSINDVLDFADPILEAFNTLMSKMGNLKQALLQELRGLADDATDPNSIRGLIAGANGNELMGGLEALQAGMALKFANALDALEGAIQSIPDTIDLAAFKMPGKVVAAIGQFKEVVAEAKQLVKDNAGTVSAGVKDLFKKLEGKIYALKRSVPGVQQLAHFLFEALGLRKLITETLFNNIKNTVTAKIQQATDLIDGGIDQAHADAKAAFQDIHDRLVELLEPITNFNADVGNLDLVALLDLFNQLANAISTHSGVLPNDPDVSGEASDLLNEAFGMFAASFPGRVRFAFDAGTKRLSVGIDYEVTKSNTEAISLDFALPGNIPVNLETSGQIAPGALAVGADLAFNFGLALDPSDTADFIFLYPDTQLSFTALLEATGMSIQAGIGGITAVELAPDNDGSFKFKKDIDVPDLDPASLTLGFSGSDIVELDDFLSRLDLTTEGELKLNFPDVAVLGSSLGEPLSVTVPLATLFDTNTWTFEIPSFDFSDIKLDLSSLFAGIDAFLGFIINAFESKLLQDLPLIGDDLGTAALVIEEFKDLVDEIKAVVDTITEATSAAGIQDALQRLLFDTLGPGLPGAPDLGQFNLDVDALDILSINAAHHDSDTDGDGDNTTTPDTVLDYRDIDLTVNIDEDGADDDIDTTDDNKNLLTDPEASIEAFFTFAGQETWNPSFDIGFNALNLVSAEAQGGIDLTLDYHAEVGVKLDKQHGFSILLNAAGGTPDLPSTPDNGEDPELEAGVTLALQDGTSLELNLFFLTVSATNMDTDEDGKKTQFEGGAALDFGFGSEDEVPLLDILNIDMTPSLETDVFLDLRLKAGIGDNPNLPTIRADVVGDWGFELSGAGAEIGDLNIALNNVGVDLGQFISKNLKPILEKVNDFLEPIRPLLDFLQLEVPIISQLYQLIGQGPFTFLDGVAMLGDGGETVAKVINLLIQVVEFSDNITGMENLFIEFGDFDLGNISDPDAEIDLDSYGFGSFGSLADAFNNLGFSDENGTPTDGAAAKDKLNEANAEDESGEDGLGIDFPIITNPANIIKLLLGQDADLITWDIPRLEASFDFAQTFGPIVPPYPIFAKIGGGFEIFLDLFVGMDTRGIRTGVASGQPGDFLKGFYFGDFSDGSTGSEVPEAGLSMYLTAGAELNIAFAKAGVEGGIKAEVNADWHDEATPGKVYLDEILLNLQRGIECIFDLNGKLSAFLGAYLEIVIPLGFTDITIIDVSFTIIEITLLDFTVSCPPLPPPEPATMDAGTLRLNIGDRAAQRQPGATDVDETVVVRGEFDLNGDGTLSKTEDKNSDGKISEEELGEDLDNNGTADDGVVAVIGFGQTRLFGRSADADLAASFFKSTTLVTGIVGNAGEGEDSITLQNIEVPATLTGGAGDDELVGGNKNDSLSGGEGNDEIAGMGGNDTVAGDGGNDTLFGNDGGDSMTGGTGDDAMYGGNNDNQEVNDGADNMSGDAGNDQLYGHAGNDTVSGGDGADFLGGSTGDDDLFGGNDNDTILGDDGADDITGDGGDDQLKGGAGNDTMTGGTGNDWMSGGQGNDSMRGNSGNDSMVGGGSDDSSFDDNGNDVIFGDSGNDIIAGDDAAIGSITLIGGAGSDSIEGGTGSDEIYGQGGRDIIYGDDWDESTSGANSLTFDSDNAGAGSSDTIYGNDGEDIIVAGDGGDSVFGGDDLAIDLILGDHGSIVLASDGVVLDVQSSDFTFGGGDTLRGGAGDDIEIGGFGADSILGNEGSDIVLGDHGRVERNANGSLKKISSTGTDQGGNDTILGYDGDDTVLGGIGDDSITGNAGSDVLLGDNGEVNYASGVITTILSTAVNHFGDDLITGAAGDDTIIGGSGEDDLAGGGQDDIFLGDNGKVTRAGGFVIRIETTDEGTGDNDTILGDNGADSAFGGDADDSIRGGDDSSIDVLAGDNGFIELTSGVVTLIESTDPTQGGEDSIWGGAGNDMIVGGSGGNDLTTSLTPGGDSLFGEDGNDIMVGDNARITRDPSDQVLEIKTIFPDKGGHDSMFGGTGGDTMLGGYGGDSMEGGDAADVMLGDNGLLDYDLIGGVSTLVHITTTDPNDGESDTIKGQDGNDSIMGGTDDEDISGGNGRDLIFGDHGEIFPLDPPNNNFFSIDTSATDGGGSDTIHGDADEDTIIGGQQGDSLFGDSHDDDMIGGHNNPNDIYGGRSDAGDTMDGGTGDDAMTGDNAEIIRQTGPNYTSPLVRTLNGTVIYDANGVAQVTGTHQTNPTGAVGRNISLLDHSDSTAAGVFGNDLMAGNADDDTMFGQLGNDQMRGDGYIDEPNGTALKSANNATDGDDYMEGNGGADTMFGDLGQDDMAGGSSNLFGLTTAAMRPDGSDTMFGGDGTDTVRNTLGDTSATGHARDADVMMGDNANIFRLVSVNGTTQFLQFNYDNYSLALKLIPRATTPLDYNPVDPDDQPIGNGDLMHGEAGDDSMHGMTGHDTMFAEGQDDDVIGGVGNDWISGGTGQDGVLGDDGRIATSRNGSTEPLSGVNTATSASFISTPGKIQQADIHVNGTLKKVVNLTPFSTDPDWAGLDNEFADGSYNHTSDDLIYGGWGDDSLHGGSGDDAISGAEALPLAAALIPGVGVIVTGYDNPVNIGNMLAFNPEDSDAQHYDRTRRAGEFALYDEYNPLTKIVIDDAGTMRQFLLNFDPTEGPVDPTSTSNPKKNTDGNDKIFGDLGNDWLVGGTGRDNLYGGWGNDLMNADDNHDTNGGLNDQPDTDGTYEDRAYGGAGRDVLIGNTGGDRLIDWVGEFNSYLVPFAPFGMATVSRTLQPQLGEFLLALSAADGADPTRAADTGADPARNGEPEGELGMVLQKDAAWRDQTGAPADPQAGNIPGGKRDVLRSANFNGNQNSGFVAETGLWSITAGRYHVQPTTLNSDAVSLFYVDSFVPTYFEVLATIQTVKPTGGFKANSYLLFDYQSPTDFKFAGVNGSTNKLEIGHRNADGWIVDQSINLQVRHGQDYNLFLSVNGNAASLIVNNQFTLSHTFAPRLDADGFVHTISEGMIGLGANGAKANIDNVVVQQIQETIEKTADFSGPTQLLKAPSTRTWTLADGRYSGTASAEGPAINLFNLAISPSSLLELEGTFKLTSAGAEGGFVYDFYGLTDYKFAVISASTKKIVLGHRLGNKWTIDATANFNNFAVGTDYTLGVTLRGTTVNVTLNGNTVLSRAYNSLVTDGEFGLFSRFGTTSFDSIMVGSDDPSFDDDEEDGDGVL